MGIGFENSPQLAGKLESGSRSKPIIPAKTILLILGMCDARVFFLVLTTTKCENHMMATLVG